MTKLTDRQKRLLELAGAVLLVAGVALIFRELGLILAGVILILAANYSEPPQPPKEPDNAGPR